MKGKGNMEIIIDKNFRIISEELNWIVQRRLKKPYIDKRTKKLIEWGNWGYFQSLRASVQRLVEHKIRMIPFSDVERILGRIDKMQKEMSKVLKPYEIEVKQS